MNWKENSMKKVTKSPYDMIKFNVIRCHSTVASEFQIFYRRKLKNGGKQPTHNLASSIMELFIIIGASMRKEPSKEIEPEELERMILSKREEDLINAWRVIDNWLYDKGYTKVDNIKLYDSTDVVAEDETMDG